MAFSIAPWGFGPRVNFFESSTMSIGACHSRRDEACLPDFSVWF
jgi:hypothetical protein